MGALVVKALAPFSHSCGKGSVRGTPDLLLTTTRLISDSFVRLKDVQYLEDLFPSTGVFIMPVSTNREQSSIAFRALKEGFDEGKRA